MAGRQNLEARKDKWREARRTEDPKPGIGKAAGDGRSSRPRPDVDLSARGAAENVRGRRSRIDEAVEAAQ